MIVAFLQFVVGAVVLYYGAEYLIRSGKLIALRLGIPAIYIGITVVAFGTSLPELIVSIYASISGEYGIVIGNIVGSNNANIGLILGLAAVISPIRFNFKQSRIDFYFLVFITLLFSGFLTMGRMGLFQGIVFLAALVLYCVYLIRTHQNDLIVEQEPFQYKMVFLFFGGIIGLWLGSDLFIRGATLMAEYFGVSSLAIGMTVVALGTSLPELATSCVAAIKGESEIAVGNILGSNLFNILAVMGSAAVINTIIFDFSSILMNVVVMVIFTLFLVFLLQAFHRISRLAGIVLLVGYAYNFIIILS